MQRKHAGLLLVVLMLAACALPITPQRTVAPLAPTTMPAAARLPASTADSVATPQLEQAGSTALPAQPRRSPCQPRETPAQLS